MNSRQPFAAVTLFLLLLGCQSTIKFDSEATFRADDGRAYRLERLEKKPASFARVGVRTLRYFPHGTYELEREDENYFYVRQYLPIPVPPVRAPGDEPMELFQLERSTRYEWRTFDQGLPRSGQWRDGFAIADINGDGHLDIVFGPARKSFGGPNVFLGDSKGHWSPWRSASFPRLAYDYGGAAVADFNLDGKPDIAFAVHLRGFVALHGNQQSGEFVPLGTGLPLARTGEPSTVSSRKVIAFDWRGNKRPALLGLNELLATGASDRILDGVLAYELIGGVWTRVTGDPRLLRATHMAASNDGRNLAVAQPLSADGSLTLSARTGGIWQDHIITGLPANAVVTAIAVTHTAHDSAPQYAIAWRQRAGNAWWSRLAVARYSPNDSWQISVLSTLRDTSDISAMTFARLDPEEPPALVTADSQGYLRVFRQRRDRDFVSEQDIPPPQWRNGCQGYDLQAKDVDADGVDELVVAFAGEGSALTRSVECANGGAIQVFKLASPNR